MDEARPKDVFLYVNGVRLHYLEWGDTGRQPMLLLHGFMSQAHIWDEFALSFRSRYRILALDQRGHGDSQWAEDAAYSIDDYFLDIHQFVEVLGLNDLILVGHSMGGRHALLYAACAPDRVERLIMVDARPGNSPQAMEALKDQIDRIPFQARTLDEVVTAIQALYPDLSKEVCLDMAKAGYRMTTDGEFIAKCDVKMTLLAAESGFVTEDLWPFVPNVTCPTLVVRGAASPFVSPEEIEKMCRMIPKAEWKEIPGAAHMPAQQNPSDFNRVIMEFLRKTD